jgi:hypothetical protein
MDAHVLLRKQAKSFVKFLDFGTGSSSATAKRSAAKKRRVDTTDTSTSFTGASQSQDANAQPTEEFGATSRQLRIDQALEKQQLMRGAQSISSFTRIREGTDCTIVNWEDDQQGFFCQIKIGKKLEWTKTWKDQSTYDTAYCTDCMYTMNKESWGPCTLPLHYQQTLKQQFGFVPRKFSRLCACEDWDQVKYNNWLKNKIDEFTYDIPNDWWIRSVNGTNDSFLRM